MDRGSGLRVAVEERLENATRGRDKRSRCALLFRGGSFFGHGPDDASTVVLVVDPYPDPDREPPQARVEGRLRATFESTSGRQRSAGLQSIGDAIA